LRNNSKDHVDLAKREKLIHPEIEWGARFLFVDNDCTYLYRGTKTVFDRMRSLVKESLG
jgi:2-keto-3-deoxy-L-rhamnonate aldolase RhmA